MKLYTRDREVPYKSTTIKAISSKHDIDGILAKCGIKKVAWNWDPENNDVFVSFQLEEEIDGRMIAPVIKLEPPRIWTKGSRKKKESINWNVSMRVMFWYIKTHLEMTYLMQSTKTQEFLPFINIPSEDGDKQLKDVLIPDLHLLKALPEKTIKELINKE